ncbi:MAG: NAD-dependent epimerase/dehydratase family protein [Clostridiales bacterium]|jgi:nucleoside-diphosphate-sugar epimerase|nr:NAD-dependent epimerase/dehydratase family protein [Clostridiales bacterium]
MKILLTGDLSPMVWGMVDGLKRDSHHVTVVGKLESGKPADSSAVFHNTQFSSPQAQHVMKPGHFQAVVFFYAYQCEETNKHSFAQGVMLDELSRFRHSAVQNGVERFILVTDQRVFGFSQRIGENEVPVPDTSAGVLIKAAEDIFAVGNTSGMKTLVVRVTNLYLPGTDDAFFGRALQDNISGKPLVIEGTEDSPCDFLHVDDFAQFISLYLDTDVRGVVHLSYGDMCTYSKVVNALKTHLPSLKVLYTGKQVRGASLVTSQAVRQMNWVPRHNWAQELSLIISRGEGFASRRKRFKGLKESVKTLEREKEERDREAAFMENMYREASEDRSQLQQQVMRSRNSYGRIYSITRELETMQPEQVFLSTLNVVENTMQNNSVAIYSRIGDTSFARLVVHSRGYEGKLTKSPDLADFPLMKERIDRGETFVNTTLEPGYPALSAPIMQDDRPIAMIALWDVPSDQQTLYHQNLFGIVAGLVQSAIVSTLRYFELSRELFVDKTHILNDKAFRSALGVYRRMKQQGISSFLLLRVKKNPCDAPLIEMDRLLGRVIRATDLVGQAENGDYLVLLPQASNHDLPLIVSRFQQAGLSCEVAAEEEDHA